MTKSLSARQLLLGFNNKRGKETLLYRQALGSGIDRREEPVSVGLEEQMARRQNRSYNGELCITLTYVLSRHIYIVQVIQVLN